MIVYPFSFLSPYVNRGTLKCQLPFLLLIHFSPQQIKSLLPFLLKCGFLELFLAEPRGPVEVFGVVKID